MEPAHNMDTRSEVRGSPPADCGAFAHSSVGRSSPSSRPQNALSRLKEEHTNNIPATNKPTKQDIFKMLQEQARDVNYNLARNLLSIIAGILVGLGLTLGSAPAQTLLRESKACWIAVLIGLALIFAAAQVQLWFYLEWMAKVSQRLKELTKRWWREKNEEPLSDDIFQEDVLDTFQYFYAPPANLKRWMVHLSVGIIPTALGVLWWIVVFFIGHSSPKSA